MVRVGDTILINKKIVSIVTALFQIDNAGRWVICFEQPDGTTGFFLEGDEEFCVIDSG